VTQKPLPVVIVPAVRCPHCGSTKGLDCNGSRRIAETRTRYLSCRACGLDFIVHLALRWTPGAPSACGMIIYNPPDVLTDVDSA